MGDIEELEHLLVVLKKYDLPVSPILEFAIKEKIQSLSITVDNKTDSFESTPVLENHDYRTLNNHIVETKSKSTTIRVIRPDGSIIEHNKAALVMRQTIMEIGALKVYNLKIPMDGMYLVTIGGNPKYASAQHDVGNGFFVNTHSNTITKKRHLEKIFSILNPMWKVEIVK